MTLVSGTRLGSYEIIAPIGAGGMGEVYRARDTKLNRDVAIKVLPESFASDPDRLARFKREAQVLASLNHPNIGHIYGVEDSGAVHGLVLELIDGATLADLIAQGPLALRQALQIARQIAEALDAAHERGIVHRDLKPANVKVTPGGRVKLLDFGLAKPMVGVPNPDLSHSPTQTFGATQAGVLLGTAAYMSPEQIRGTLLDKRTDIWAFGCVLTEMLSGRRVFAGDTVPDTITAILGREPDWSVLPAGTPLAVRRLLQRCLEKDVKQRLRDIGDAPADIDHVLADLRATRSSVLPREGPAARPRPFHRLGAVAALVLAVLTAVTAGLWWMAAPPSEPVSRSDWTQLTNFPDSVAQPSLSPDGRMLTFIRGAGADSFTTPGQVYVKLLPDGEPKQLTSDRMTKMSPVFSPDGSRIAYTTVDAHNEWDTWVVPVLGGEPRRWLPNASGLIWTGQQKLLFSEKIRGSEGNHMKVVAADESRANARDLYVPMPKGAMAHRSYPSPDARWALVAEMTDRGAWTPCRLLPTDASSPGRHVGPPGGACLFAAWSPDGAWMYFSSSADNAFHVWRQRFREGDELEPPEQITSGPTEEEGIAIAPDGRSFITAVGLKRRSVWLRDSTGERPVSLEGYALNPIFSRDGKKLVYFVSSGASAHRGELWIADLATGLTERLLPGFSIGTGGTAVATRSPFDVSPDGQWVVFETSDSGGQHRLWLAPLDRRSPPRQIPNVEGDGPLFSSDGAVFFRAREGDYGFAYRVRADGTGRQKVHEHPVIEMTGATPDGRWLAVYARPTKERAGGTILLPVGGGTPVPVFGTGVRLRWSTDGDFLFITLTGRTFVLPVPRGQPLPSMPPTGFASAADIAAVPGVRLIDADDPAPGPTHDVYAFSRETVQRNLYRVPLAR
jgi:serine/threonine protein kinase/Tol biopolymer transport system component